MKKQIRKAEKMKIPKPIKKARPLVYPFDLVQINMPYDIPLKGKEAIKKSVSIGNAARQYAKRHKLKFTIRSHPKGVTIYRTK